MIVFKTIFPNGKIYIAQTTKLNHSNYFGSGRLAIIAIRKYGKKNLKKEILRVCKTQKQLDSWERIFVKKFDSTNSKIGYNLERGGKGRGKTGEVTKNLLSKIGKTLIGKKNPNYGKKWTKKMRLDMRKKKLGLYVGNKNPNYGRRWTDEMKKAMSEKKKGKYIGENNPNHKSKKK